MTRTIRERSEPAESLVGSLCRELDRLRCRAAQVQDGLSRCQDGPLLERLRREQGSLRQRQHDLQRSARTLAAGRSSPGPALALLLELSRRPLVA